MADVGATFRKPFAEQVAAFRLRLANLVPTARWDDLWQEAHDRAFVVAGALKADLLADLAEAVRKGIEEGTSLEEFRRDFRAIVERRGWHGWTGEDTEAGQAWRTKVIYRTNMLTSYAAGRHAQLVAGNFAFWVYRHGGSREPRVQHLGWDGLILPPDHPFWATHFPPNGWGCNCRVAGADDLKGALRVGGQPGKSLPEGWDARDPRTGAPTGIDKGWGYAPGRSAVDDILALAMGKARPGSINDELRADVEAKGAAPVPRSVDEIAETTGFSRSMPPAGLKQAVATIGEVADRFDMPKLRYLGSFEAFPERLRGVKRALACYVPARDAVCIRATSVKGVQPFKPFGPHVAKWTELLDKASPGVQRIARKEIGDQWLWSPVHDLDTLLVHELGHRLHFRNYAELNRLLYAWAEEMRRDGWGLLVSQYGLSDIHELVAEAFVLYLRGGDSGRRRIYPPLLKWFEEKDRTP